MRNSTFWSTLLIAVGLGLVVVFVFYPERAAVAYGQVMHMINPRRVDVVKLEYTMADPARARGWQAMRSYDSAEECLPALARDYSRDTSLGGQVGALRCVAYNRRGELVQVLRIKEAGS